MLSGMKREIKAELQKNPQRELGRAGSVLNVHSDGFYQSDLFLKDVKQACHIVDKNSGGVFKPIFLMDWSPIHAKKLDNALNAKCMNVRPCGHQPLMEDGFFLKDGIKVTQHMVFQDGPNRGMAKGLKKVCSERFGADAISGERQDDLVARLEAEEDFCSVKPRVVKVVEEHGGKVMFTPKFHPELAPIECVYRDISRVVQEKNVAGVSAASYSQCNR